MYNFEFKLTEQDYINLNLHFFSTSKSSTKMLMITRLLLGLFILILSKIIFHSYGVIQFAFSVIIAIIVVLIFNPLFNWLLRLRIKSILKEGSKGDMFGNRKIHIDEYGIHSEKSSSTSYYKWEAVTKLDDNEKYIFLFFDRVHVLQIPKTIFERTEAEIEFVNFCREKIKE